MAAEDRKGNMKLGQKKKKGGRFKYIVVLLITSEGRISPNPGFGRSRISARNSPDLSFKIVVCLSICVAHGLGRGGVSF